MNQKDFSELDITTQISLIITMHIRNEMEDFHVAHLSDSQMKELNPIIRQATYNILTYLRLANSNDVAAKKMIDFEVGLIPDYWELPDKNSPIKHLEVVRSIIIDHLF